MSVFNFSTKENTKENYNELLDDSSVLNFNCVEECIFPNLIKLHERKFVLIHETVTTQFQFSKK